MLFRNRSRTLLLGSAIACGLLLVAGCAGTVQKTLQSPAAMPGGDIVLRTAAAPNADPFAAGQSAARALEQRMGGVEPHAVLVAECYDNEAAKKRALAGICSVFPADVVHGGATYGSFGQEGCLDADSVGLLGIGGKGISVAAALEPEMGTHGLSLEDDKAELTARLRKAGANLAAKFDRTSSSRLVILIPDAHSPKNQIFLEGFQEVTGKNFPITGGCANKNEGETFVYYRGRMYRDSAIALLLSGDFNVSLAGRKAQTNDAVIATAREGAAEALSGLKGKPFAMLAFNCAGRKGKLDEIETELAAIQEAAGKDIPLFGAYCAGEIGPADPAERQPGVLSSGKGWHVMFTVFGR